MLQFHKYHVQNRPKLISIVGDRNKIDMERLAQAGKVVEIGLEDIFVDVTTAQSPAESMPED